MKTLAKCNHPQTQHTCEARINWAHAERQIATELHRDQYLNQRGTTARRWIVINHNVRVAFGRGTSIVRTSKSQNNSKSPHQYQNSFSNDKKEISKEKTKQNEQKAKLDSYRRHLKLNRVLFAKHTNTVPSKNWIKTQPVSLQ